LDRFGKEQAVSVANRLVEVQAEVLVCSDRGEAIHTAEIISKETHLSMVVNPDWNYEGTGEPTTELLMRARSAAILLAADHKGKKVIAVTNGVFIAAIITTMIYGDDIKMKAVTNFFKAFIKHKADITVLNYDEEKNWWSLAAIDERSPLA
jgi:broad specificity phosphatase PhoE